MAIDTIDALNSFPDYQDYKDLGKLAYANAVKDWLVSLLTFQSQVNTVTGQLDTLKDDVITASEAAVVAKITWKGAWASGSYVKSDAVEKDGTSYIANKDTSETPSLTANDWDVLSLKGDNGTIGSNGLDGENVDHISKTDGTGLGGSTDTYTMWQDAAETIPLGTFTVYNGADGNGVGDMLKSTYDSTDNGIVDDAEKVNGHTVESDVPINAVFTDTVTEVLDILTSTDTTKALSAHQGKVLKDLIDNFVTLIGSDDVTLDTLQEIVDFIKLNKSTLDTLGIANIAGLQTALDGKSAVGHTHIKSEVGLGNVDNTSDTDKPVSTAQQAALDAKQGKYTSAAMAASNVDLSVANVFSKTLSADLTITVSNVEAAPAVNMFILYLTNGGAHTVTHPAGTIHDSGVPPTLTAAGTDKLGYTSKDGGTTWDCQVLALDIK